jgi:hypothetical protein
MPHTHVTWRLRTPGNPEDEKRFVWLAWTVGANTEPDAVPHMLGWMAHWAGTQAVEKRKPFSDSDDFQCPLR